MREKIAAVLRVFKSNFSPEDVADLLEGYKDALSKDMSPPEATIYAVLETQSEEVAENGTEFLVRLSRFAEGDDDPGDAEARQQLVRSVYRATAQILG